MKRVEWDYEVKALITLSGPEVDALVAMAKDHYDHTVRAMAKPASPHASGFNTTDGTLHGWLNSFGTERAFPATLTVTSRQLGLICKALEPLGMAGGDLMAEKHPEALPLWLPFRQLQKDIADEYIRLCADPIAQAAKPPEPPTALERILAEDPPP